jgi:3-phosphoshikimate 1-carboxyvinyltransferase
MGAALTVGVLNGSTWTAAVGILLPRRVLAATMDVTISPSGVAGTADAPPSKSYTHRALLAAGYGDGALVVDPLDSADTRATAGAVEAFGGTVADVEDGFRVEGFGGRPAVPDDVVDCANSGTTMRLLTAAAALADGLTVLTGDGSLRSRPQGPLLDAVERLGGRAESTRANGQAPLVVGGPIEGGTVAIPGDVSSQFVTALLMAGAVTDDGVVVDLETELKSAPYVDVTLELLDDFGVDARRTAGGYAVDGGQSYAPAGGEYAVPGDFSSISYLLSAGAVGGDDEVTVAGARPSAQGDDAIVDVLRRMGADVDWDRDAGRLTVARSSLSGVEVGVADTPDLLPTIAALGAVADGDTRVVNCEHVRYKETDRVAVMAEQLERMGASVTEERDALTVHGRESTLEGATVDGHADHRIVMALAVAALAADGETTLRGAEHVDVSFPDFFDALAGLGAAVER